MGGRRRKMGGRRQKMGERRRKMGGRRREMRRGLGLERGKTGESTKIFTKTSPPCMGKLSQIGKKQEMGPYTGIGFCIKIEGTG